MEAVLHTLLITRLRELEPAAAQVVERECGAPRAPSEALPVWLRSIEVEGFRGIGPPATLRLAPEPGLTVVAGGNGSGKSSFAEALELLMTGEVRRWTKRPKAWTDAWQCLHHPGPTRLAADLETGGGVTTLSRSWARGSGYDAVTAPDHAWSAALDAFRPFLSYAELATMLDTLTSLYDALSPVLGLGDLDDVLRRGRAARRAIADRAIANWRELRQGSSVDLREITLRKAGRNGRADFGVCADGALANALGVMSQGELLALSLSVFLPRMGLDESPFRFAVIDDPVQAMDASTVEGLARVLQQAAATRQIVVFTHDDRLPEAIRRLRLEAEIVRVQRRRRSNVALAAG